MLTSVVSVFFYLRIVVHDVHDRRDARPGIGPPCRAVALAGMLIALVAVFYLGVLPGRLLSIAANSVASIF